jgi:tetratricopeptide (TPR) repeat protein
VTEIEPKNVNALTGAGIVLAQLKRYDEAKATLEAALAINPELSLAQATLQTVIQKQQQQFVEQQQRQQEQIMQQIFQPQR